MLPGDIYRHARFYADSDTGELKPKFLIVLACPAGGDLVARLLTSRHAESRSETPACHHGAPYPGYFLGVLGDPLVKKSWIDLRPFDDLDSHAFERQRDQGILTPVAKISGDMLCSALECAASADDTTRQQERHLRDTLARIR